MQNLLVLTFALNARVKTIHLLITLSRFQTVSMGYFLVQLYYYINKVQLPFVSSAILLPEFTHKYSLTCISKSENNSKLQTRFQVLNTFSLIVIFVCLFIYIYLLVEYIYVSNHFNNNFFRKLLFVNQIQIGIIYAK